jgi:hypothetical protein
MLRSNERLGWSSDVEIPVNMPPSAAHRQPKTVRFLSSRPARLLGGFVAGALPGFVLLAGPSIVMGDVAYSVLLPAAFAIVLLVLPAAAWAASRRDRPALAVWALMGVLLGVLFSLAVWLLLLALAAGSFSFTPGKQSGL